ncbi:probable guanine nucleotide exchange factor MCF2L2 [Paramacrobiotus metropolitanus]|uniref:probable guanine nucleotide exchange factor MCF2L2 n=1 Tax=Paramacrobiotus metropolitanus TaxID=2943436 RepID=UPI0024461EBE|nr:probable guanine nucleotide exchange factor MCF2L2 [Paramacrobiotus metropolitanus]
MNEQTSDPHVDLHRKMSLISMMAPHPDLLYKEAVTAPGGLSKEQHPIIVIPDNYRLGSLTDDEIACLFTYFAKIHTPAEQKRGFVVIADRRNDTWPATRSALLKIREHFPAPVEHLYCLEPNSLIQKTIGAGYKQINGYTTNGYPIIRFLQKPEDIPDLGLVSLDQLPPSLGGPLMYDHKVWCEHRLAVEKYEANTCELDAESTDLMDTMRNSELPNEPNAIDEMIKDQLILRNHLKTDINDGIKRGNALQECVLQYDNRTVVNLEQIPDRMRNILIIRECMERLAFVEKQFDQFWSDHYPMLLQCQQLRRFEVKFRQLFPTLSDRLRALKKFHDKIEQAIDAVKADDLDDIISDIEDLIPQAKDLLDMGRRLISKRHYADDSIRPKCRELEDTINELETKSKFCNEKLHRCTELEDRMTKAEKWCHEGMDRLSSRWLRHPDAAPADLARDIDQFLAQSSDFKLDNPREFHNYFKTHATQEMNNRLPELLREFEEVKELCHNRRNSLVPQEVDASGRGSLHSHSSSRASTVRAGSR